LPNNDYLNFSPLSISTQPVKTEICEAVNTSIIVVSPEAETYQWEVSTDGITWTSIRNNANYTGSQTSNLNINNTPLNFNTYKYRVQINRNGNSCGLYSDDVELTVHPAPIVNSPATLIQCDDDDLSTLGFSLFNLTEVNNKISTNAPNETFTYYLTQSAAILGDTSSMDFINNPTTFQNRTVSTDVVWARVESSFGCASVAQIQLNVSTTVIPPTFIAPFNQCDDFLDINGNNTINNDDTDGIASFDFSSATASILSFIPPGQSILPPRYFRNEADALAEVNEITDPSNYRNIGYPGSQFIFVRIDSAITNDCLGLGGNILLTVNPLPEFNVETLRIVCSSDPTFSIELEPIETNTTEVYNYEWLWTSLDGTISNQFISNNRKITVSTSGTYTITLTKTDGTGCSRTKDIFVKDSELATITHDDVTIVDFSENNSVTIDTSNLGKGNYQFALQEKNSTFIVYQDEPLFNNIAPGFYTIYVKDEICGVVSLDISIIGYPKYFTPNGDGVNDYWGIKGINAAFQANSTVFIFDRYGKLIKQLSVLSDGWDGTFNGTVLPNDDYWFKVSLEDGRQFSGHFALKR
jgi:gliding motility-associated-like protein